MDTSASLQIEDFYNRDPTARVVIEVTFANLNDDEKSEFASYVENDSLVVQRRFPGGAYFGSVTGCEEFEGIRERIRAKDKVSDITPELKKLVESGKYPGLKPVAKSIDEELARWESENPTQCKRYFRAGVFQGPPNIAGGKLRNRAQFVYIPPVREAESDATAGGRQSALTTLVSPLVKAITDKNSAVQSARQTLQGNYVTYKGAVESAPEKDDLEANLTELLQRYEGDAAARIQLSLDDKLPLPQVVPRVWLREDGFEGEVAKKGHGLQRLFIFTILELYEKFRAGSSGEGGGSIVLAIEEPELYQHPARSRSLAKILHDLTAADERRAFAFQIFLTTHSPYFVGLDTFQSIRRVQKADCAPGPMQSKIAQTTLKQVGVDVLAALGRKTDVTELTSWARLRSVLGVSASEGFFADGVILVEGDEDEAMVAALAQCRQVSLDAAGIVIVQSGGKTALPNLAAVYSRLGIKVFTIFDADGQEAKNDDAKVDYNIALLKMLGESPQERPATMIGKSCAVWEQTMRHAVVAAVGEAEWNLARAVALSEYKLSAKEAKKKYAVIWRTTNVLLEEKRVTCEPLDRLWAAIVSYFGLKVGR